MRPQLDLIGLIAADMATSLAFYRRLGLEIPPDADQEPHVEHVVAGGIRLAWDTEELIRRIDPDWQPGPGAHRVSLAFRCENPAAVDREHAALVAAGYESAAAPFDAFWGQRYATVYDPDRNPIDLFAPLSS